MHLVAHNCACPFLFSESHISRPQIPMFNILEIIQRVLQQSVGPYLKEAQPKCKPETCSVKRDPFTFI